MTAAAFEHADLIRRVARQDAEPLASMKALADELARDPSNLRKTINVLVEDGVFACEPKALPVLTDLGRQTLRGIDIAQGVASDTAATVPAPTRWPLDRCRPNPANRPIHPDTIPEMAEQIVAAGDILQPCLLTPPDANGVRMILAGERRWRGASLLASQTDLSGLGIAAGLPFVEREATEVEALKIIIIENSAREDMTPLEDARQLLKLAEASGWSGAELARQTGRSTGGDRNKEKDVTDKLRIAREATPDQIADYEVSGSWDALRNAVFGRNAGPSPLDQFKGDAISAINTIYGVGLDLPQNVAVLIEEGFHAGESVEIVAAEVGAQYKLKPLPEPAEDLWLREGWTPIDMTGFSKTGHVVGGVLLAPRRAMIPDAPGAPTLTLYVNSGSRSAMEPDGRGGERLASRTVTLYRARATVVLPGGRRIESSRIPGSTEKLLAIQMATEDLIYRTEDTGSVVIRPALEWLDAMSGPFVVGGRETGNASRAQERRFALGWDKRESNSGGGSTRTAVDPEPTLPGTDSQPEAKPLSPRARLAMVELAHKMGAMPRSLATGGPVAEGELRGVFVGRFWTDPLFNELASGERLIRAVSVTGGVPPMATLTDAGNTWLLAQGYEPPISDAALREAQGPGVTAVLEGVYSTDFLANEVAPAPASPVAAETQPELLDDPIDRWGRSAAEITHDQGLLAEVAAFKADPNSRFNEARAVSLLAQLNIEGPFTEDGEGGVVAVVDGDAASLMQVDYECDLAPERVRAMGLLVAWALETVFASGAAA